jgi:chromate reductase, NAD(P)H dehydrogenase (quinone)
MKNILIISATLKNNYNLAKELDALVNDLKINDSDSIKTTIISLEDYKLPLYTECAFDENINNYKNTISKLTNEFVENQGIIICAPEYNGSIPPIVNNAIAWISTTTDYWRDAFNKKVALIGTSSGGAGTKYITTMKLQMEHLGCIVMPRAISANKSNPLNEDSAKKILKQFIELI